MDIRFIRRSDIDKIKWNTCVYHALNGNVFGYVWFLDQVGKQWDALVEGDYESVLPLIWRKHWSGGREIFQPPLIRELGLFSTHILSQKRLESFLDAIPPEFRFIRMVLNERNIHLNTNKFNLQQKTNHQLFLKQPYSVLRSSYSADFLAQLLRSTQKKYNVTTSIKPEQIADFYRLHTLDRKSIDRNYFALQRIMYNVLHRGWGYASGVFDQAKNLLACNFFIYSHNKSISFIPLESPLGSAQGALAHLMDVFIRNHANTSMILDLNTHPGQEQLARNLGAQVNHYYEFNRMPQHILGKWMAKLR